MEVLREREDSSKRGTPVQGHLAQKKVPPARTLLCTCTRAHHFDGCGVQSLNNQGQQNRCGVRRPHTCSFSRSRVGEAKVMARFSGLGPINFFTILLPTDETAPP